MRRAAQWVEARATLTHSFTPACMQPFHTSSHLHMLGTSPPRPATTTGLPSAQPHALLLLHTFPAPSPHISTPACSGPYTPKPQLPGCPLEGPTPSSASAHSPHTIHTISHLLAGGLAPQAGHNHQVAFLSHPRPPPRHFPNNPSTHVHTCLLGASPHNHHKLNNPTFSLSPHLPHRPFTHFHTCLLGASPPRPATTTRLPSRQSMA